MHWAFPSQLSPVCLWKESANPNFSRHTDPSSPPSSAMHKTERTQELVARRFYFDIKTRFLKPSSPSVLFQKYTNRGALCHGFHFEISLRNASVMVVMGGGDCGLSRQGSFWLWTHSSDDLSCYKHLFSWAFLKNIYFITHTAHSRSGWGCTNTE